MKRRLWFAMLVFVVFAFASIPLSLQACTFRYSLTGPDGKTVALLPDRDVSLLTGKTYTLSVTFIPDHRTCTTPVDETAYFTEGESWKAVKDGAPAGQRTPLALVSLSAWAQESPQRYTQTLTLNATAKGRFDLEVVRDCPKGGYDDFLNFVVK